ncbi:hypothetical protein AAC387_Pa01g2184 [Persea americana]
MTVLRSRTILPETLKSGFEDSPGLEFSPTPQPARRRSLRLASKSSQCHHGDLSIDADGKTKGSDSESESPEVKNKRKERNSTPAKKARVLDVSDSESGNVKRNKCVSKENEETENRKALKGVELGLDGDQVVKDGEEAGVQEEKKRKGSGSGRGSLSSRRKSSRLAGKGKMETGVSLMFDLNSVPEDEMETKSMEEAGYDFHGVPMEKDAEKEGTDEKQVVKKGKSDSSSGKRIKLANVDLNTVEENKGDGESVEDFFAGEPEMNCPVIDDGDTAAHGDNRYGKEEKGKGKALVIEEDWLSIGTDANKMNAEGAQSNGVFSTNRKKRYSKEEKGKGKFIENSWLSISGREEKLVAGANGGEFNEEKIMQAAFDSIRVKKIDESNIAKEEVKQNVQERVGVVKRNKERFLATAKHFASRFAHFERSEEEDDPLPDAEIPMVEAAPEDEDWPGPFSTAVKILEERAAKLSAPRGSSRSDPKKDGPVIEWVPSQDCDFKRSRLSVPSLYDICFSVLCKNAEAITSLDGIPDAQRSQLSHRLCDSRKMNHQILSLIVSGSPSQICIKDCSCITEEQFQEIFQGCNTEHLRVLQLDLSGRCTADYILRQTLARSPNSLSSLTTVSLRGAYRLSDDGLHALVSSAPSLKSINLGACSLLTSTGINILAENLASVLKELYIDDCQNVDALSILPALMKLKHLEILSVADIRNVCDKFVCALIPLCGPNMKELVFSNCGKLTDTSLKAIAENCSGLRALDLVNLKNLTDSALRHLANGCRSLQVLKLCRNEFSDQGIAEFLGASGESLNELSLNNIKKVANNTAIALAARCSKTLSILDLSWCDNLGDEALGLIVDKCLSLRLLKLFGCTQISLLQLKKRDRWREGMEYRWEKVTDKFVNGHSNPLVKIIGLKLTPILEHLQMPDTMQSALLY